MKGDVFNLAWPASKLGEAIDAVARRSGLAQNRAEITNPPEKLLASSSKAINQWVETSTGLLGVEAEPVHAHYPEVERFILDAGPAIVALGEGDEVKYLALLEGNGRKVSVLAPDFSVHRVRPDVVGRALTAGLEAPHITSINRLLTKAGVGRRRLARARECVLRERLSRAVISGGWLLRLRPGASFWQQIRQARLPRRLYALVGLYSLQYCLGLLAWWILGKAALGDQLDKGWLMAWALLLLTAVPFRLIATWAQGLFAIGAGSLLKQRLLYGALRLEPEEIRHEGAGRMLGRVIESNAVESLALTGGFLGAVAVIELAISAAVLAIGAGGALHVVLLAGWLAIAGLALWKFFGRRRSWTDTRLAMTNDLIERMVGHRTRLAQERREAWHEGEDQVAERYLEESTMMDRAATYQSAVARGWLLVATAGLTFAFLGGGSSPPEIAISIGGIILASRALTKLTASVASLMSAAIAWQQVAPLFNAATRQEKEQPSVIGFDAVASNDKRIVLEAHDVAFRYQERGEPVLRGCSLNIRAGDRLLLRGSSGGGKSTLASLLTGLRRPDAGLMLLGGLDHRTLGSAQWRRRVVSAPQFHENHVLTATFAFNLLMGRDWPPAAKDFEEAESLCRELGLSDLLGRMPAGLLQMVGETGWQLSHGERSRLFIARALLQNSELIILDESFAALDPENLRQCLSCVMARASAVLIIAHP